MKNTDYLKKYLYVSPFIRTGGYDEFWFYKNIYPNLYTINRVFHPDDDVTDIFRHPYAGKWVETYSRLIGKYGTGNIESGYHKKNIITKDIPDVLKQKNFDPKAIILESMGTISHRTTHKYVRIFTIQKIDLFGEYRIVDFELFSGLIITSAHANKAKLMERYHLDPMMEIEIVTNKDLMIKPYIDCIHQLSSKQIYTGIN